MKKIGVVIIALLCFTCIYGQKQKEEEAIKKVLKDVILNYQMKDFDKYSTIWVHEPNVMRIINDGSAYIGWDVLGEIYKTQMEENPNVKDNLKVELPEVHIKIYDNTAWAFNIHKIRWTDQQGNEKEGNTWNLRFLEKKDGKWKIACYVDGPYKKVEDE